MEKDLRPKVAFLGPNGTFSHQVMGYFCFSLTRSLMEFIQAAYNYFGEGYQYYPEATIASGPSTLASR
jgi:hypothetical protein